MSSSLPLRQGDGQATIELLGAAAVVLVAGLIALQVLAAGYAAALADHAAEAAALALANGRDPEAAALDAVPGWPRRALRVRSARGRVTVTLLSPAAFGALRRRLTISGDAAVRLPQRRGS